MKWLLSLILVGALSPVLAVDHTVFHELDLDYKTGDNFPVDLQCLWQANSIGQVIDNRIRGMPEIKALLLIKQFGAREEMNWSAADIVFMVDSITAIYEDDNDYTPEEAGGIVYTVCLQRRSVDPIKYI